MPCRDEFAEEQSRQETVTHLHDRTRMLCGLCELVEKVPTRPFVLSDFIDQVPGLRQWWTQHKEQDRQRKAGEEIQRRRELDQKRKELEALKAEIQRLEGGDG